MIASDWGRGRSHTSVLPSSSSCCPAALTHYNTGLLIIRGKKIKISRDFQGRIRGKKVKICGKIGQIRGFLREKKSKFAEKSADFAENFGGKLRQETISKKQLILLDFVLANFAKIDSIFVSM